MKCLVKRHDKTGDVSVEDVNLLHHLKNPSNLAKDDLPLWRFCTLKAGAPLKADQTQYDTIHMIILEIDKGYTIQEIEAKAAEFTYAIHTTSSHTPELHRFRLMLPLDMSYPDPLWRLPAVKKALIQKFASFDNSTFVNYQKIPVLPANPADYYYNVHNGRAFSFDDIADIVKGIELDMEIEKQFNDSLNPPKVYMPDEDEFNLSGYIEKKVIGRLDGVNWHVAGDRSNTMIRFCGTWKTASRNLGFDVSEVRRVVLNYRMPEEFKKIARKHLR